MHLLATEPGMIADGSAAVDLGQTPGDVVVLMSADTEIALLAAAQVRRRKEYLAVPSLRLACASISGDRSTPTSLRAPRDASFATHRPVPQPRSTTSRPTTGGSSGSTNRCSSKTSGLGSSS